MGVGAVGATVLAGSMVFAGVKPPPRAPDTLSVEDRLIRVQEAEDAGAMLRETGEFDGAIEQYESALQQLAEVPDERERELKEPSIVVGLVETRLDAYVATKDASYLVAADIELKRFMATPFEPDPPVQKALADLRSKLDGLRAEAKVAGAERESWTAERQSEGDGPTAPLTRKQKLVIAGATVTGIGGGFTIGFVAALAAGLHARAIVRAKDNVDGGSGVDAPPLHAAYALAVFSGVGLATGIALLIVGKKSAPSGRWVYSPLPLRRGAGLGVEASF